MTDHTAKRTRENLLKAGLMTVLELDERPVRVDDATSRRSVALSGHSNVRLRAVLDGRD